MSGDNRPPASMADVARVAGVSIGSVSRALRDRPGVSQATRAHIRRVAADLSYVISPEASALARRSTGRVGVVVPMIGTWFYSTMLSAIEGVLRRAELDVLIYQVEGARDRAQFFERLPHRRKVDAVIVVALPFDRQQMDRLELMGVHVVVAGGELGAYPHTRIDDVEAGSTAVRHLIELGHRRIGLIRSHDPEGVVWQADISRTEGYRKALEAADLQIRDDLTVTVPWGADGGGEAMGQLMELTPPPTGVFVYSDEMAFGALHRLRQTGVDVPKQVSIVSVDDHPYADLHALTTVCQPVREQGIAAARMALDLLEGRTPDSNEVTLSTPLVVRDSTGPPPD